MNIEKSCGAIVYRKSLEEFEFLAVKSNGNGHWGFPKGHMEKGESEYETAKREVLEETGLSIKLIDGFKAKIEYPLNKNTLKEVTFFIGISLEEPVKIQKNEIQEFRWLKYNDMIDILTFENSKQVLIKARNFLNN